MAAIDSCAMPMEKHATMSAMMSAALNGMTTSSEMTTNATVTGGLRWCEV